MSRVEVSVTISDEQPASSFSARISSTLQSVADKALIGRKVSEVEALAPALEGALREVMSRVLLGYRVKTVTIRAGTTPVIQLQLAPSGPVVREAFVRLSVDGVDPRLSALLSTQMDSVNAFVNDQTTGLPVEAFEWARLVLEPIVEQKLTDLLPGFRATARIEPGEATIVTIGLTPQAPTVVVAQVQLVSDTIPATLLHNMRGSLTDRTALLKGLPVAFLQTYRKEIQGEIDRAINSAPSVHSLGLTARSQVVPGEVTNLRIRVESQRYRLRMEAAVSIGESVPGPELRTRAGAGWGGAEVFIGNSLTLTGLDSRWLIGVGLPVGFGGELTWQRYLEDDRAQLALTLRSTAYQRWRVSTDLSTKQWELVYGVNTSEYSSVELGVSQNRTWVALVANL